MIPPRARRAHTRAELNSIQVRSGLNPATYVAREDDGLWITPTSLPDHCDCHDHRVFGHGCPCPLRLGPPPSWRNAIVVPVLTARVTVHRTIWQAVLPPPASVPARARRNP